MFFGQFDHNIDDKGRLTIPARYRDLLESGAYITLGFDKNLLVLRNEEYDKLYHKVAGMSITNRRARDLARSLFGNAVKLEIDNAGRILIPQFLRSEVGLTSAVKLVGIGPYFEIWAPETWQENNRMIEDAETRATMFEGLDLTL